MKNRFSILLISHIDFWSLGENAGSPSFYNTLQYFTKNGIKVYFVTFVKGGSSDVFSDNSEVAFKNLEINRFMTKFIPYKDGNIIFRFVNKILFTIEFLFKSYLVSSRIIKNHQIDIIYGYETFGFLAGKILQRKYRLPIVFRVMGVYNFPKTFVDYFKKIEMTIAVKYLKSDLYVITDDGSEGDKYFSKFININKEKFYFLMNGIDKSIYKQLDSQNRTLLRKKYNYNVNDKFLLMVSTLHECKQHEQVLIRIHDLLKHNNIKLLIAGDGKLLLFLKTLTKKLGIEEKVLFVGVINRYELVDYYNMADLFITYNSYGNKVNTVYEAFLCGCPVLALNTGDTIDLVRDGKTGFITNYQDNLPTKIMEILNNGEIRQQVIMQAKEHADKNLMNWENRILHEINILRELI